MALLFAYQPCVARVLLCLLVDRPSTVIVILQYVVCFSTGNAHTGILPQRQMNQRCFWKCSAFAPDYSWALQ